jgi:hypothetical protein
MPGLVPGIHVFAAARKTWMAGAKPGHDAPWIGLSEKFLTKLY